MISVRGLNTWDSVGLECFKGGGKVLKWIFMIKYNINLRKAIKSTSQAVVKNKDKENIWENILNNIHSTPH